MNDAPVVKYDHRLGETDSIILDLLCIHNRSLFNLAEQRFTHRIALDASFSNECQPGRGKGAAQRRIPRRDEARVRKDRGLAHQSR